MIWALFMFIPSQQPAYYTAIYFVTLLLSVVGMFVGYYSGIDGLDQIDRELRNQSNLMVLYTWIVAISLIFISGLCFGVFRLTVTRKFIAAYAIIVVSSILFGNVSLMLLIGGAFFLVYQSLLKSGGCGYFVKNHYIYFVCIWCIAPWLVAYFSDRFAESLEYYYGFRGFSFDRVEYAYFVGFAILLITIDKRFSGIFKWLVFGCLAYGAVISQTRFVFLAMMVSFLYRFGVSIKSAWFVSIIAIMFALLIILGSRDDIGDSGRADLYMEFFNFIISNPFVFAFGQGSFYSSYSFQGTEYVPENFLLETVLNFGIVGLLAWVLFVYDIFSKSNREGRSLILYLHFYGLFHPGVSAFMIQPLTALLYLSALGLTVRDGGAANGVGELTSHSKKTTK